MTSLKELVQGSFARMGIRVSRLGQFPVGNDLCFDLKRIGSTDRFSTIFDVGANAGRSVLTYAAGFPKAKIYSFEPVKATYDQLVVAAKGLPNVRCFQFAMGDTEGSLEIYLQKSSEWNSLTAPLNERRSAESSAKETIQIRKVDDFCAAEGITSIDLLKTDTEGFDIQVLRGAERMLTSGKVKFVYSEVTLNPEDDVHTNFFKLHEYLEPLGFRFVALYEQDVYDNLGGANYTNALYVNRNATV
ncbi:FkbM family methyltransferase [Isosphaeraceae bacterium EP7]